MRRRRQWRHLPGHVIGVVLDRTVQLLEHHHGNFAAAAAGRTASRPGPGGHGANVLTQGSDTRASLDNGAVKLCLHHRIVHGSELLDQLRLHALGVLQLVDALVELCLRGSGGAADTVSESTQPAKPPGRTPGSVRFAGQMGACWPASCGKWCWVRRASHHLPSGGGSAGTELREQALRLVHSCRGARGRAAARAGGHGEGR